MHGYIYLLHAKDTNFYKMGVTQNLKLEIQNIQNNVPFEIEETTHTHTFFAPLSHYDQLVKQFASHYTFGNWLLLKNDVELNYVINRLQKF